jgi:hypothetical protein
MNFVFLYHFLNVSQERFRFICWCHGSGHRDCSQGHRMGERGHARCVCSSLLQLRISLFARLRTKTMMMLFCCTNSSPGNKTNFDVVKMVGLLSLITLCILRFLHHVTGWNARVDCIYIILGISTHVDAVAAPPVFGHQLKVMHTHMRRKERMEKPP